MCSSDLEPLLVHCITILNNRSWTLLYRQTFLWSSEAVNSSIDITVKLVCVHTGTRFTSFLLYRSVVSVHPQGAGSERHTADTQQSIIVSQTLCLLSSVIKQSLVMTHLEHRSDKP